jgi:hypothetical protein
MFIMAGEGKITDMITHNSFDIRKWLGKTFPKDLHGIPGARKVLLGPTRDPFVTSPIRAHFNTLKSKLRKILTAIKSLKGRQRKGTLDEDIET